MRIQGAARAQIEIGQMVGKTSQEMADRARKKEIGHRIDAAEEQLEAAKDKETKSWIEFGISTLTTAASIAGSFFSAGTTLIIKVAEAAVRIGLEIAKNFVGSGAKTHDHEAKLIQVEAEKAKEVADRNQQRARQTQQEAREFSKEIGQQLKELKSAVRV